MKFSNFKFSMSKKLLLQKLSINVDHQDIRPFYIETFYPSFLSFIFKITVSSGAIKGILSVLREVSTFHFREFPTRESERAHLEIVEITVNS